MTKYSEEQLINLLNLLNLNLKSVSNLSNYLMHPIPINDQGLITTIREFTKNLDSITKLLKDPAEAFEKLRNISVDAGDLSGSVKDLYQLVAKPLRIDDRELMKEVMNLREEIKHVNAYIDKVFGGEIKFIGEKLHKIDERLKKMEASQKKEIELSFRCDGFELVKKPIGYQKDDPIENPDKALGDLLATLETRESTILIKRFGLLGYKSATLEKIGKELKIDKERVRQIESKALRKCRHPSRKNLVMKCKHKTLVKCITGDEPLE